MKKLFIFTLALQFTLPAWSMDAKKRIEAAEKNIEGKSFQAVATMTVKRGDEERNIKMKMWWEGRHLAFLKVLEPKKDKGTANLRIKMDLWQYLPKVNRIIRVPSSMMLQSWMGSDFSNDDLIRGGSILNDYTHKEILSEKVNGHESVKIECTPKPDAPVVWGKVNMWVRASDNSPVKQEFFTEKGDLIKVMEGDQFKKFGTHTIPTKITMRNMKKKNSLTTIIYETGSVEFDADIPDNIFTQENLRRP